MKNSFILFTLSLLGFQYVNAYESPASLLDLKRHSEIDYYSMVFGKHNYYIPGDTLYLGMPRYEKEFDIVQAEHPDILCCDYEVRLDFTPKSRLVYEASIRGVSGKDLFVRGLLSLYQDLTNIYGQPDSVCYQPGYYESGEREYFSISLIGEDTTKVKNFFEEARPFILFWTSGPYRIELSSHFILDFECTIKDNKVYEIYLGELACIEAERQASEKNDYIFKVVLVIIVCVALFFLGRMFFNAYKKEQEEEKAELEAERKRRIKKQTEVDNRNEEYKNQLKAKYGTITRILPNTRYDNDLIKQYDDIIVFEESQKIIISKKEYNFSDIISCSMYDDNHKDVPPTQVTRTSTSSMLGRAAVGGLTLGVAGAFVGAITAKTESSPLLNSSNNNASYIVKIGIKSIEKPTITLQYGNEKSRAEEVYAMMQAIIAMK